jgi:hypothetical protein
MSCQIKLSHSSTTYTAYWTSRLSNPYGCVRFGSVCWEWEAQGRSCNFLTLFSLKPQPIDLANTHMGKYCSPLSGTSITNSSRQDSVLRRRSVRPRPLSSSCSSGLCSLALTSSLEDYQTLLTYCLSPKLCYVLVFATCCYDPPFSENAECLHAFKCILNLELMKTSAFCSACFSGQVTPASCSECCHLLHPCLHIYWTATRPHHPTIYQQNSLRVRKKQKWTIARKFSWTKRFALLGMGGVRIMQLPHPV